MKSRHLVLSFALALACRGVQADPGDLDLRFSVDGVVLIDAGGLGESVYALAPDADNAAFAAGRLYQVPNPFAPKGFIANNDMTVVRLLGNGDVDHGWGTDGVAQAGLGGDDEYARDLLRLPDGSLLVAGSLEREAHSDFGVARFTPEGFPDQGFGEVPVQIPSPAKGIPPRLGAIAFDMGPPDEFSNDEATALALQSTGKIIVAGIGFTIEDPFRYRRFGIARLTAQGELDPTFSGDGKLILDPLSPGASEYVTAIARRRDDSLTPDDGFILAGYSDGATDRAVLRRFLADGTPDPQFGTGGLVTVQAGTGGASGTGMYRIDDAVIDRRGRIVVVGRGNDRGFVFMRFNPNGTVDASFGVNGRRLVKFSDDAYYDSPNALTLQADGKIVAVGEATSVATGAPRLDFASTRLLPDGAIDTGYGDNGRVVHALSAQTDIARAVTVTSDGSLLIAGEADFATPDNDMAFLRLQGDPTIFADGFEN